MENTVGSVIPFLHGISKLGLIPRHRARCIAASFPPLRCLSPAVAMPTMDDNPLFGLGSSNSDDTSEVSFTSSVGDDAPATTPPTAVLQTVNIKSHIPVVLELAMPNYDEWRCFFDAFLGKFSLTSHVSSPPTADQRHDPDCRVVDQCILSWLYNSIAKDVRDIVRHPKATAYRV